MHELQCSGCLLSQLARSCGCVSVDEITNVGWHLYRKKTKMKSSAVALNCIYD